MAGETTTSTTGDGNPPQPATPQQLTIPTVEVEGLQALYANFVKVSQAPEELILDFGLNPNLPGGQITPVKISQRLVLNYYTAKRLWGALGLSIQRHEQTFGVLEIDVNKRVLPAALRTAP